MKIVCFLNTRNKHGLRCCKLIDDSQLQSETWCTDRNLEYEPLFAILTDSEKEALPTYIRIDPCYDVRYNLHFDGTIYLSTGMHKGVIPYFTSL